MKTKRKVWNKKINSHIRIKTIQTITTLVIWFFFFSNTFAYTPRNIPGVEIISRSQRKADENIRVYKPTTTPTKPSTGGWEPWTPSGPSNYQIASSHLVTNYPTDVKIDYKVTKENDQRLTRPYQYRKDKKAIVIHHTASDPERIKQDGIVKHLQNIYKFHTKDRKRGDIGYNFLIDSYGNIYEWRAGGEWVIGAHTRRNNPNTIGISLIGNYEIQEPSEKQLDSLIKLSASLADKYNINPDRTITVHEASNEKPFLKHHTKESILWHKDASNTSCPGENVYKKLPYIRQEVKKHMLLYSLGWPVADVQEIKNIFLTTDDLAQVTLPFKGKTIKKCELHQDQSWQIDLCEKTPVEQSPIASASLSIKQNRSPTYGEKTIVITDGEWKKHVYYLRIMRDKDIESLQQNRKGKENRENKENESNKIQQDKPQVTKRKKKQSEINTKTIEQLTNFPVKVLLDEVSQLPQRKLQCQESCQITLTTQEANQKDKETEINKKQTTTGKNIEIRYHDNEILHITVDKSKSYFSNNIDITDQTQNPISITNYERKSYAGIPRNSFRQTLLFKREKNGFTLWAEGEMTIINKLSLEEYMKGIVETNDQEPYEKIKTMAMISKNYMIHYLHPNNRHPNIETWAQYNAIDDPDQFQKYVGAGLEKTLKKRPIALEETEKSYIMYKGKIAFTPYFSCSKGYTKNAETKRWWTDTPYLQNRIDFSACQNFEGHGVGLAGKGASYLASRGVSSERILQHYYPWTNIYTAK